MRSEQREGEFHSCASHQSSAGAQLVLRTRGLLSSPQEAVADAGWADVASLIPDELSADAALLLPKCPCVEPIVAEGGGVFAGSCLVRTAQHIMVQTERASERAVGRLEIYSL